MDKSTFDFTQANFQFCKDYSQFFNNKARPAKDTTEYLNSCGYTPEDHTITSGGHFGMFSPEILKKHEDSFLYWTPRKDGGYVFVLNPEPHVHVFVEVFNHPEKNKEPRFVAYPLVISNNFENVVKFFDSLDSYLIRPHETKVGFGI